MWIDHAQGWLQAPLQNDKAQQNGAFLGAPGATRTRDLWFRRPTLYPTELQAHTGGEGGIRTLDRSIHSYTRLAGERLQPLGHFSGRRLNAASATAYSSRAKPARQRRFGAPNGPQTFLDVPSAAPVIQRPKIGGKSRRPRDQGTGFTWASVWRASFPGTKQREKTKTVEGAAR